MNHIQRRIFHFVIGVNIIIWLTVALRLIP
jgi:hypothetical protein